MIAAVCGWHEHHRRAVAALERRLERGDPLVVAASAVIEAYAVLTRFPAPYRLAPSDALALLDANFMRSRRVVALDGRRTVNMLRSVASGGVTGGRTYDAAIAACARKARARELITFNEKHFLPFASDDLEIVVP
jgi:predicted nucleic acid-binding protein